MAKHLKILWFLLGLGFLVFSNSLHSPFLIDDHAFFEQQTHFKSGAHEAYFRPLAIWVPLAAYKAFGVNAFALHSTNVVLFCLAGWGIYVLLRHLGAGHVLAFLASVFYIIHPINGVAVNYLTASVFSVQVILMLGALYLYTSRRCTHLYTSGRCTGAGCLLYLFSTWCHETAMALPFYAFILCAIFMPGKSFAERLRRAWGRVWPLFGVLAALCVFRLFCSPLQVSILAKIHYYQMSGQQFLATWTMLLSWYISRLFWPHNIVLIMAHQPLKQGLALWLAAGLAGLACAACLIWVFRREKFHLLGLLVFIAGFVPFTLACLVQPVHGLTLEPHWFIFPVTGFFIFWAAVFERILARKELWPRAALAVCIFTSVFFSRWHNWVWADELRYCRFWLSQSPDFVGINAYLAQACQLQGKYDLARQYFYRILPLGYKAADIYAALGTMDLQQGKWESAKENFIKTLRVDPHYATAWSNLGVIYFKEENYTKAMACFVRSNQINPNDPVAYLDIVYLYTSGRCTGGGCTK